MNIDSDLSFWIGKGEVFILPSKSIRLLIMFQTLLDNKEIEKQQLINKLKISERTFERDIDVFRDFLDKHLEAHQKKTLGYDYKSKKYKLDIASDLKFKGNQALSY